MADLAELLVAKTCREYELLTRDAGSKLKEKPDIKHASRLLQLTKSQHDNSLMLDDNYKSEFISELVIDGFDDEQIWQQQELQNETALRGLLETFSTTNIEEDADLCFISMVTGSQQKVKLNEKIVAGKKNYNSIKRNRDAENSDSVDNSEEGSEESDAELARIKQRLKTKDSDELSVDGSFDSEDDTLFQGAEEEEEEEEEEEDRDDFDPPDKKIENLKQKEKAKTHSRKIRSEVDDKFFRLAEMEEFLEREDQREEKRQNENSQGEESGEESDNINMFEELSDDSVGKEAKYADFFDPPDDEEETPVEAKSKSDEEKDSDNPDEEEDMSDDDHFKGDKKQVRFSEDSKKTSGAGSEQQSLSNFEKRNERLRRQIEVMEEEIVKPKSWQMSGEVAATARPENSLLEEHVQFEQSAPAVSEITEEFNQSIEDLIKQRCKDKAFDDNQRQVRPREEVYEFKTQKVLDQEKSKLSLHEVYEQEYLKLHAPEKEETNPLHEEVKKMMAFLFPRLDALASWHYTPTQAVPEVKIRNNLPAIQMEESTPITMVNSTVLAPEEIKSKQKSEMKGKTERSKEDKRRERKQKKVAKRQKAKEKEKNRQEIEKLNPGLGNKFSKQRALKELEKHSKGNIEVIKEKKAKKSMSSRTFFSQLQEEVTTQIQTKTEKEKEKKKQLSSDRYLL